MNTPVFDVCAAGSLANATLCAGARAENSLARETPDFEVDPAPAAPQSLACAPRWRRLVDTLLSPISGPTLSAR